MLKTELDLVLPIGDGTLENSVNKYLLDILPYKTIWLTI
jgi:hypothetical protein